KGYFIIKTKFSKIYFIIYRFFTYDKMSSCRTSCYRSKKNGPTGATGSTGLIGPSGSAGVNNNTIEAVHYADLWVDKNGNNDTGTGTFANPFLTIPVALNAIVDASSAKRYVIHVGSGEF